MSSPIFLLCGKGDEMMIRVMNKYGKESAASLFNRTHSDIYNKYVKNKKRNNDEEIIEKFLRDVKKIFVTDGEIDESLEELFYNMAQRGIDITNLFNYTNKNNNESGIAFEEDLSKIIDASISDTEYNQGMRTISLGQKNATSSLSFSLEDMISLDKISTQINNDIKQYIQKKTNNNKFYHLSGVQGKIDLRVPKSQMTFQYNESSRTQQFFAAINGKNITAKNYTLDEVYKSVELGETNLFRVYSTLLPDIGRTKEESLRMFYIQRYYNNNFIADNSQTILLHHYHIRFTYELTGAGMVYLDGKRYGPNDLLIINDRNTENIYVYDTYKILQDILNQKTFKSTAAIYFTL